MTYVLKKKSESTLMSLMGDALGEEFMAQYWTTVGNTIYTPTMYDHDVDYGQPSFVSRHSVRIAHEEVHVKQWASLGKLQMGIMLAFPQGRWRLEREAYLVDLRADPSRIDEICLMLEKTYHAISQDKSKPWFVAQLAKEGIKVS